jgi:hypothetical protein
MAIRMISLLNYGNIRVTLDNEASVFDTIEIVGGQKSPRKVWERLTTEFPELVTKCHYFQFPGQGQRMTPVVNQQNMLYLIGLLPGKVGTAYREDAAREMCRKYGVNYDSLVTVETTAVETLPNLEMATLEVASKIAQGIMETHKAVVNRINKVENLIQGTAVDLKGEIREGNHVLAEFFSDEIESVQNNIVALHQSIDELSKPVTQRKTRSAQDISITFHCRNKQQYLTLLNLAEKAGMSRSQFFLEIVLKSLDMEGEE